MGAVVITVSDISKMFDKLLYHAGDFPSRLERGFLGEMGKNILPNRGVIYFNLL